MKPAVLVVGSMNMDLVMYGLDGLPKWGTSTFGNEYKYAAGGKGANQAFAAAKQGADCYMVGRVGNDENGRSLLKSLEDSGVHTDYVVTDLSLNTGLSTMNMGAEGNYYSIYVPGANTAMCIQDLKAALEGNHFDMIIIQLEMPRDLVYHICKLGKQTGIPVFLDAGPAMQIPLSKLEGTFIISPNEAETKALTGITPDTREHVLEAAKKIYQEAHPKFVLLKLGKRGAFLYSDAMQELIPGFQVHAVDTTAAGDTFGAAFCVQYCMGRSIKEAIRYAHAAAAICVTRKGGQPSIPSVEETAQFYQENI